MNPLKASMASIILAQHAQLLRWLSSLPFVDASRIGFYGLSYGGWTAVRIPPLLDAYCLSICSANFNDWVRKVTSVTFNNSYMQDHSFEMLEWNAGNTFNYAEMAYLMAPRSFMVERGMHDPVAPDSWVASEYAKVRWLYTQLGIVEKTEIEFFNGEHVIHGEGTFQFLHKHLRWPESDGQE
jgi:cephalosporin-C deacetylase-like acetyl esterase